MVEQELKTNSISGRVLVRMVRFITGPRFMHEFARHRPSESPLWVHLALLFPNALDPVLSLSGRTIFLGLAEPCIDARFELLGSPSERSGPPYHRIGQESAPRRAEAHLHNAQPTGFGNCENQAP